MRASSLETGAPDTQKNELKPWKKKEWCIPKVSGEFVARMEAVAMDLYHQEYNPERPVVCFAHPRPVQAIDRGCAAAHQWSAPGRVERYDTRVIPASTGPGTGS